MSRPGNSGMREGHLLLADISGYTEFLTGTELEHAHEIIRELTALIRERLAPPMRFVKREGDAVFCYANAETFRDGERLVELIEACYFDFSNRLLDMARATTCRCKACAAIGSLGLKFLAHYGSFVIERDEGREDLAGPAVILAHRLLKNTISEGGGPKVHCGHGPGPVWGFRECIDWRPFTYFTSRTTTPVAGAFVRPQPATETVEFQPLGEQSTRIVWRFRVTNRSRISLLALRVFRPFWLAFWRRAGAALISIAEEDAAIAGVDEQGVAEGSVARVTRHF